VVYLAYIFSELLSGRTVEGWTSLMVVLLFLGAAQLVTLGIIGEYIGRIYDQTRGRPRYVVKPDNIGIASRQRPTTANVREQVALDMASVLSRSPVRDSMRETAQETDHEIRNLL
jgi:hypothetical protein